MGLLSFRLLAVIEHIHMVKCDFVAKAAQAHALLAEVAAAVTADTSGLLATEVLPEVLGAVRQGELATCRLLERVDRTGEFSANGAASTVAYLRNVSGETSPWASGRVLVGRALADRMPATTAGWQSGDLGLAHAAIIRKATTTLEDDLAAVVKAAAAPEDAEAAAAKNRANQKLNISRTFDGMYRIDGWLDTEAAFFFHPQERPEPFHRRRPDRQTARRSAASDGPPRDGPCRKLPW